MSSRPDPFSHLDRSSRSGGDRAGSAPVKLTEGVPLAKLIKRELLDDPTLVMLHRTRSLAAEKFLRLKTILSNEAEGNSQVIVVTSTGPSEGKSFVAANLALAFAADAQNDVLLIDADLRRPSIETWISPPPKLGVTELLEGKTELDHTVLHLKNSPLKILPAGTVPKDPVTLLASEQARQLIAELRGSYKRIVIDTPPILPFTDADVLGALSDGALMVVRAGKTRRSMLAQALDSLTSTRMLGTVFNDVTYSLADRGNYSSYDKNYYHYYQEEKKQ